MRQTLFTRAVILFVGLTAAKISPAQFIEPNPATEEITLQGRVTDFSFRSPSSSIGLLVSDATGISNWTIEAPSALQLRKLGWDGSSLFKGEILRLRARRLPNQANKAELISLTKANGAILLAKSQATGTGIDFANVPSGRYSLDKNQAYMFFSFDHRGFSRPKLRFDRFNATLNYNNQSLEKSSVRVDIDVSSLNSGNPSLDTELRGEKVFDSLNHPRMSFQSTSIVVDAWGRAKVRGTLDIKGQKRPLKLDAQINRTGFNPDTGKHTIGVSLTGTIKRSDWGFNQSLSVVKDQIQIQVEAEFVQPAAR